MSKMILCIFTLLYCWSGTFTSWSQPGWKASYKEPILDSIYYDFTDRKNTESGSWYFPEFQGFGPLTKGLRISNKIADHTGSGNQKTGFTEKFSVPKNVGSGAMLLHRVFAKNIKTYEILFHVGNQWYRRVYEVSFDGYQIPIVDPLTAWGLKEVHYSVDMISVSILPKDHSQRSEFIVGDIKLFSFHYKEQQANHPFFDKLFKTQETVVSAARPLPKISNYMEDMFSSWYGGKLRSHLRPTVNMVQLDSCMSEMAMFLACLELAVREYPFYKERMLDKDKILERFNDQVLKQATGKSNLCDVTSTAMAFVDREFDDGHFKIKLSPACLRGVVESNKGPVRLYSFWHGVYVAAVLDTALWDKVKVGDQVVGIDTFQLVPGQQEELDRLMTRPVGSSVSVKFKRGGTQSVCSLTYRKKYESEHLLKPIHCEFRMIRGAAYFRINNWGDEIFTRFLNHWNDGITSSNGVIIDLRSNSGGNNIAAMRFFSMFISAPEIYSNVQYFGNERLVETIIIQPHGKFSINGAKRIIILADDRTSCASEEFILAMKRLPNIALMAASNTKGVLAERVDIKFPSGLTIYCDAVQPKILSGDLESVEAKGIVPDIWVMLTSVDDLYQYNDKLLTQAVNYLQ